MSDKILDKKSFEAIHDLKNDIAHLSRCIDRLKDIAQVCDISDKVSVTADFMKEYTAFIEKYESSVNDKIKAFIAEIIKIVIRHKAEFVSIGVDVSNEGKLSLLEDGHFVKCSSIEALETANIFDVLNEALLNAEIHMERFIPEKYLSYDKQKDYRIINKEGNIYTREI